MTQLGLSVWKMMGFVRVCALILVFANQMWHLSSLGQASGGSTERGHESLESVFFTKVDHLVGISD